MFGNIDPYSPVEQKFIWVAEYYNGGLKEFEEDKRSNSFYNIERNKLQRFGLVGEGKRYWFECYRGVFNLNGDIYELLYLEGDKRYKLTGQDMFQRDIITYKEAVAEADMRRKRGKFNNAIVSYNFGYKTEFSCKDEIFSFKPIVTIPTNGPMYIDIHLVVNKNLKGELFFIKNGNTVDSVYAPLRKDVAGGIQWILK